MTAEADVARVGRQVPPIPASTGAASSSAVEYVDEIAVDESTVAQLVRRAFIAGREPEPKPDGLLIDVRQAAKLLGITESALYQRVKRRRVPGLVRSGAKIEFHRPTLLASFDKRARHR